MATNIKEVTQIGPYTATYYYLPHEQKTKNKRTLGSPILHK